MPPPVLLNICRYTKQERVAPTLITRLRLVPSKILVTSPVRMAIPPTVESAFANTRNVPDSADSSSAAPAVAYADVTPTSGRNTFYVVKVLPPVASLGAQSSPKEPTNVLMSGITSRVVSLISPSLSIGGDIRDICSLWLTNRYYRLYGLGGGCSIPLHHGSPLGDDCTSLPGVAEVSCLSGSCYVDKCLPGYQLAVDNSMCMDDETVEKFITISKSGWEQFVSTNFD